MNAQDQARRAAHLVEPGWLKERLADPGVRIVDMRGAVRTDTRPDGEQRASYEGRRADYAAGHVPGAIYLDWTVDLVDETDPVPAQVAPPDKLASVLGSLGIGDEHLVVAYDDHPASQFATRLWWVLRYYGHDQVRVLDGGYPRWLRAGMHVSTETPRYPLTTFTATPQSEWRVTADQLLGRLRDPGVTLVDARDEGQYAGRIRRGQRGGHIPGAVHLPREALIDEATGQFLPTGEIRERTAGRIDPAKQVIAYCNGGVAATVALFALSMAGCEHLANYDGSWNEWGNRADLPVEK